MRRILLMVMVGAMLFISSEAEAVPMGVGLRAGTLGFGLEYSVELKRWLGVRGAGYWAEYSDAVDIDGNDYDATLTLGGFGGFVDFYPFKGNFRITAGLLANENMVEADGRPTQDQDIGDNTYTPAQIGRLSGEVTFDATAFYVGIGWGRFTGGDRLGFLLGLGAMRQGSGDVELQSTGGGVDPVDLRKEETDLKDDIEPYEYWPVLNLGMSIRF